MHIAYKAKYGKGLRADLGSNYNGVEKNIIMGACELGVPGAEGLQKRLNEGKTLSNYNLGSLTQQNEGAIQKATKEAVLSAPANGTPQQVQMKADVITDSIGKTNTGALDAAMRQTEDVTNADAAKVDAQTLDFMNAFSKKANVNVNVAPVAVGDERYSVAEGMYNPKTNTITFAPEATKADVVKGVAMHEVTHAIETSDFYDGYKNLAVKIAYGDNAKAFQTAVNEKMTQYAENGLQLTPQQAESEGVAQITRSNIFADETAVNRLVQENPSIATRIYEAIKRAWENIKATFGNLASRAFVELDRARRMFEKALGNRRTTQPRGNQYAITFLTKNDVQDYLNTGKRRNTSRL
ncbi:MAG: hypothetical protein VB082_09280 [Christensenella sp.]|nr:hypothetical protein [Christensenella sp.]